MAPALAEKGKNTRSARKCPPKDDLNIFCILFLLHPIDNTLVVQYQLV